MAVPRWPMTRNSLPPDCYIFPISTRFLTSNYQMHKALKCHIHQVVIRNWVDVALRDQWLDLIRVVCCLVLHSAFSVLTLIIRLTILLLASKSTPSFRSSKQLSKATWMNFFCIRDSWDRKTMQGHCSSRQKFSSQALNRCSLAGNGISC